MDTVVDKLGWVACGWLGGFDRTEGGRTDRHLRPLVSRRGYYTLFAWRVREVQTLITAVWAVWHSGRADVLIPQE